MNKVIVEITEDGKFSVNLNLKENTDKQQTQNSIIKLSAFLTSILTPVCLESVIDNFAQSPLPESQMVANLLNRFLNTLSERGNNEPMIRPLQVFTHDAR